MEKKSWGEEEKVYGAADAFALKEAGLGSQLERYEARRPSSLTARSKTGRSMACPGYRDLRTLRQLEEENARHKRLHTDSSRKQGYVAGCAVQKVSRLSRRSVLRRSRSAHEV